MRIAEALDGLAYISPTGREHVRDVRLVVRVELGLVGLEEVVGWAHDAAPLVDEARGYGVLRRADGRPAHLGNRDTGGQPLFAVLPCERGLVVVTEPGGDQCIEQPLVHRRQGTDGGKGEEALRQG